MLYVAWKRGGEPLGFDKSETTGIWNSNPFFDSRNTPSGAS
jgi:hypothetical protein